MAQTLNISEDTAARVADMVVGCRVDRTAAILSGGAETLFTVVGGSIVLTAFYGEIMVLIDSGAGCTLTLDYDVDVSANGSVYVDTPLGSIGGDIDTYVAGRMIYLPVEGGALTYTAAGGACPVDIAPIMTLPPGHFVLTSGAATTLGTIRWSMWYIPVDPGAYVVSN
jgi:hypothetical protein